MGAGGGLALELKLAQESAGPSGYVVALPEQVKDADTEDDPDVEGPLTALKRDLGNAKGTTAFVESTSGGNGDLDSRPRKDWQSERFGANPPSVLQVLRSDVGMSILSCCGLPTALFDTSDGTSQRESWRRFTMGSVEPLAALVEAQISAKLEDEVKLDFTSLWAHDIAGRGASFKAMVTAGLTVERAAALSGLLALEGE